MWALSKLQKTSNNTGASITKCKDGHEWWASFEFYPLAVGARKSVFEGRMYIPDDYWSQTEAVVKTVNIGQGDENELKSEVRAAIVAEEYSKEFVRNYRPTEKATLKFVRPIVAVLECTSIFNGPFRVIKGYDKVLAEGEVVSVEELIKGNFVDFIRKNGVVSSSCGEFLQAFCHFTFSESGGQLVICGLQGTCEDNSFILTTPTIHSRGKQFGKTDGGEIGIQTFFSHHICNKLCKHLPSFGYCEQKAPASTLDNKILQEWSKSVPCGKAMDEEKVSGGNITNIFDIRPPAYDGRTLPPPYETSSSVYKSGYVENPGLCKQQPGVHGIRM